MGRYRGRERASVWDARVLEEKARCVVEVFEIDMCESGGRLEHGGGVEGESKEERAAKVAARALLMGRLGGDRAAVGETKAGSAARFMACWAWGVDEKTDRMRTMMRMRVRAMRGTMLTMTCAPSSGTYQRVYEKCCILPRVHSLLFSPGFWFISGEAQVCGDQV